MRYRDPDRRLNRYLRTLTPCSEFIGIVGIGYADSFYRVFIRATKTSKWWRFEYGAVACWDQKGFLVEGPAQVVHGYLEMLGTFEVDPDRPALVALLERARTLCPLGLMVA